MDKNTLREMIKNKRLNMPLKEVEEKSEKIRRCILDIIKTKKSDIIMLYIDFNNEVKTLKLIDNLIKLGKTVVVPFIDCKDEMEIVRIDNIEEELIPGKFGVLEPKDKSKTLNFGTVDMVITPGVVFDTEGNRIGFGGGYYDKFLALLIKENPKAEFVGICYDFQLVEKINTEEHDIMMSTIVTNKEIVPI